MLEHVLELVLVLVEVLEAVLDEVDVVVVVVVQILPGPHLAFVCHPGWVSAVKSWHFDPKGLISYPPLSRSCRSRGTSRRGGRRGALWIIVIALGLN